AAAAEAVIDAWKRFPRAAFVSGGDGVKSTAPIMEMARDLSRNRADLYEIAVWRDGVHVVDGKRLFYFQAVHQESDVGGFLQGHDQAVRELAAHLVRDAGRPLVDEGED